MTEMKKLTVGIVEPVGGHGGMDYYDYGLASGLGSHDVNVRLYTCDKTTIRLFRNVETTIPFVNMWKNNVVLKVLKYVNGHVTAFNDIVSHKGSIVHLHFFAVRGIDWLVLRIAKLKGLKIVVTIHDVNSFHGKSSGMVERECYRLIDGVVVHNQSSYELIRTKPGLGSADIAIIPHGNYLPFIDELNASEKNSHVFTILFFGQIKKVKGLDVLISAAALLKAKNVRFKLLIAGKAWKSDLDEYREMISALGLDALVSADFRYIPDDEVAGYYSRADLVVLPYREIYQSGVLLLTMSYGKPVLCSDLLPFKEIIEDGVTGFMFRSGDPECLCSKLESIISAGPELCKKITDNADILIRGKYDWEKIGKLTKDFYLGVLDKK